MPIDGRVGWSKSAASFTGAGSNSTRSTNALARITPRSTMPNTSATRPARMDLLELIAFTTLDQLAELREGARAASIEGLMLKDGTSPYLPGGPKGNGGNGNTTHGHRAALLSAPIMV